MASGDLVQLSDSDGDIDTSDALTLFEGFQKVFVVNGVNLKVADFINCELTHGALTTAHDHGDVLTQATSAASMIVDFTNTAKTKTYGYVTTGTFDTSHTVTGDGSGTSFTPSATDTGIPGGNAPHWYDWTVYPGGASGSMPAKAYLGCLYRGRCVLSGNPNYPHQWYMSRVAEPWDWAYTANDALSPVAGNNSDAGEMGDIIRALAPYRDEYLVFGCANSIWVMRGDPADNGTLEEIDITVGMFGAESHCFDSKGNLFFMSDHGLYMLPYSLGPIQPISHEVLPNMIDDENLDPTVHRVCMAYDAIRQGILINITTLTSGSNSNYFFDLRTQGFFPETYNAELGVYSSMFYNSVDDEYRGLIVGCADGYVRKFDESTKNDQGTSTNHTITSYLTLPVLAGEDYDKEVKLTSLTVTTAGGASGGSFSDTDGVDIEIYKGRDAETVIEDIEDGATPLHDKSLSGTGRANRIRLRARGHSIGIRAHNDTASSTWALEQVAAEGINVGKVK
jgi:hypothetical protein